MLISCIVSFMHWKMTSADALDTRAHAAGIDRLLIFRPPSHLQKMDDGVLRKPDIAASFMLTMQQHWCNWQIKISNNMGDGQSMPYWVSSLEFQAMCIKRVCVCVNLPWRPRGSFGGCSWVFGFVKGWCCDRLYLNILVYSLFKCHCKHINFNCELKAMQNMTGTHQIPTVG